MKTKAVTKLLVSKDWSYKIGPVMLREQTMEQSIKFEQAVLTFQL